MSKAVLTAQYVGNDTYRLVVRAGAKGKGRELFAIRYWDNPRSSESAHVALADWQRSNPDIEVSNSIEYEERN